MTLVHAVHDKGLPRGSRWRQCDRGTYPDVVPTLTDGVVTLRAHTPDDIEAVVEQSADPLSVRWTTVPTPYEGSDGEQFVGVAVRAAGSTTTGGRSRSRPVTTPAPP